MTDFTSVIPSTLRSLSSATFIGPGPLAVPGAGCGNAVDIANADKIDGVSADCETTNKL